MSRCSKVAIGNKYGMLTAVAESARAADGRRRVLFRCDCGTEKVLDPRDVAKASTLSCGCHRRTLLHQFHVDTRRELQDLGWGWHLVPLTRGQEALIDSAMAAEIGLWKWTAIIDSSTGKFYAVRRCYETTRRVAMHCFVYETMVGPVPEGMVVDHKNGDSLDNRLENLRLATPAENARNRRIGRDSTSGYKGVSWDKQKRAWVAFITRKGEPRHYLGQHATPEEAHAAYCEAAKRLHGEFARFE